MSLGQIIVGISTSQLDHTIEQLKTTILFGSFAAIIFAVMGGWFLAGRALRPVERMRQEAREIAEEGSPGILLAERIDDPGTEDELSRLAQTFNSLLERIEQAFANERRFIADASHELRTPLTAIRGNVDVLLMQARRAPDASPEQIEALEDAQREIGRMGRLLEDLLMLARADASMHEPVGAPPDCFGCRGDQTRDPHRRGALTRPVDRLRITRRIRWLRPIQTGFNRSC